MFRKHNRWNVLAMALAAALSLSACGAPADTTTPSDTESVPPAGLEEPVQMEDSGTQPEGVVSPLDGETGPAPVQTTGNETGGQTAAPGGTDIVLSFGGTVVTATLDDSKTSRDFLALLPLTLDMTRFDDREYAASLRPAILSQDGEAIDDFENGDVTYYAAGNALAIFFDQSDSSGQGGLIRMGTITSDLNDIIRLQGNAQVRIDLAGREENGMTDYDFSLFSNVEITGADLSSMSGEQLAVLYQQARYCQAMTEADTDAMREIVSEDHIFTHMSGQRQTREEYFADVAGGSLRYFTVGMENPVVSVSGDTASVTYTSILNADAYGARGTYRMGGTHWYEKRSGEWIAVNAPK